MAPRLRHSHAIRAHKGAADQPVGPDPEDECTAADFKKFREKLREFIKRPPDMPFREELDKIDEYNWSKTKMACCNTSILHLEARALSLFVCGIAKDAIKLASRVMDCAGLRFGMPGEISLHTIKQTVTMYVCIFLSTIDDTYQGKATMETIVSFLGALGGVAAISHILLQDALANLDSGDSSSNYGPDCDVDRARMDKARREFEQKLNNLKHKFRTAPPYHAYKILRPTLVDAIILTGSFVIMMTVNRKRALGQVQGGATRAPDDGEPDASDTGSDSVCGK